MKINNGEILFIKSVKDGIPNRDPLNDSDVRRLFPEEDGRISLSDVSIKRDVRDFVLDFYPDGGAGKSNYIFVQEKQNEKGKLLGRGSLAQMIAKDAGKETESKENMKDVLIGTCFDVRTFGIVYSVKPKFNLTGPVQFGWAHSMHPVDSRYVQGTVVMPSTDSSADGEEGKTQGTIWTSYLVPFAVFLMPGIINAKNAEHTGMTHEDQELLLRALWQGTQHRQARGRGQQQPLLLVHVEYKEPYYRIGYLEDLVAFMQEEKASQCQPTSVNDITIDLEKLLAIVNEEKERIARCRIWCHQSLSVKGDISGYQQPLW